MMTLSFVRGEAKQREKEEKDGPDPLLADARRRGPDCGPRTGRRPTRPADPTGRPDATDARDTVPDSATECSFAFPEHVLYISTWRVGFLMIFPVIQAEFIQSMISEKAQCFEYTYTYSHTYAYT